MNWPRKSSLQVHHPDSWVDLSADLQLPPGCEGVFLPQKLEAHVVTSPFVLLNMCHEYLGHGGFCEHSSIGQALVAGTVDAKTYHNYYEGYAYWLEKSWALDVGLAELYQQKPIHPYYRRLVQGFDEHVAEYGLEALLELMGFRCKST